MMLGIDEWCPNDFFYLGKAISWSAYDGMEFIPVEEDTLDEEAEEEEEEMEEVAPPKPPKKVKWWQKALAFCCCCYEVDF